MHALIENGAIKRYPYSAFNLKRDNPNVSFPANLTDEVLLAHGVHRVFYTTPPAATQKQVVIEGTPVFDTIAQRWVQTFVVDDKKPQDIEEETLSLAKDIRGQRNAKLAETDWRFRSDMKPSQEWIDYCQALRDITTQPNFPLSVEWPVEPQ